MMDIERMQRALVAADAAGDTAAATQIAQALRSAQPAPAQGPGIGERVAMGAGDVPQGARQLAANIVPQSFVNAVSNPLMERLGQVPVLGPWLQSQGIKPTDNAAKTVNDMVTAREADYQGRREAAGQTGVDWARMGGNVAATLPLAVAAPAATMLGRAAMGGAALGGANAALAPVADATEENFGTQKGRQVLTGAATGAVAGPAAYMLGRAISPNLDPNVAKLNAEGVQMTPGQILGGAYRRIEDASTSLPVIGDKIRQAQQGSVESFNRAALNRVLEPLKAKLPDNVAVGRDAINYVDDAVSAAYQRVLPRMVGKADAQFSGEVNNLLKLAGGGQLPADKAAQLNRIVESQIVGKMQPNGTILGDSLKGIESELGRLARTYKTSASADDKLLGDAVYELQRSFRDMLARVNPPELSQGLREANQAFSNLIRVERAAATGGATEGVFTPAQLSQAVRMSDASSRRAATARGDALMQDLSDAGKAVLPPTMGDSGTFTRGALNAATLSGLGTAALTGHLPMAPVIAGGLAYGAYTQPAQRLAQALLAGSRPAAVRRIGDYVTGGGAVMAPALGAVLANSP